MDARALKDVRRRLARGRRRLVGVVGSGTREYPDLAAPLGAWLARAGYDLLTGGGAGVMAAVSRAFFEVADRRGVVIGVLPGEAPEIASLEALGPPSASTERLGGPPASPPALARPRWSAGESGPEPWRKRPGGRSPVDYDVDPRYPNPWVEIAIYTHLPWSGERGTSPWSRNHINVLSSDALVALPGAAGTVSEVWLARQYGVPVIAYLGDEPDPGFENVPRARTLEEVTAFIVETVPLGADF